MGSFSWWLFPVEFEGTKFNSILTNNKVFWEYCLCEKSPNQWGWTQNQAQQVLVESELDCFHWFSTVFDHGQLNDDCGNQDDQEQRIIKEMLKHVWFCDFQLSSINFVENLQQDENVEEDWVMFTGFIIPVFDMNRWWNTEKLWAWDYIKKYPWRGWFPK